MAETRRRRRSAAMAVSLAMVAPLAANVAGAYSGWFAFAVFGAWMLFPVNTSIGQLRAASVGGAAPRFAARQVAAAEQLGEELDVAVGAVDADLLAIADLA